MRELLINIEQGFELKKEKVSFRTYDNDLQQAIIVIEGLIIRIKCSRQQYNELFEYEQQFVEGGL